MKALRRIQEVNLGISILPTCEDKDLNNLTLFRLKLLTRCQQEFLKDWLEKLNEVRNDPNLNEDDKTEKEILLKKRYTGHMIFIGNLLFL